MRGTAPYKETFRSNTFASRTWQSNTWQGGGSPVGPALSIFPLSQMVVIGFAADLTATLVRSTAGLMASVTNGTLSTTTPASGVTFHLTDAVARTDTITVTDLTDSLTATATVTFVEPSEGEAIIIHGQVGPLDLM